MNKPTFTDYENASLYAYERAKLETFNYFLMEHRHIFSHVNIEIRRNKNLDSTTYEKMNRNIQVRLIASPEFSKQITCNLFYPRGRECKTEDLPKVFKSGNSDVFACQASCFNLTNKKKDADGNYFRSPMTFFDPDQGTSIIQNDAVFRLGVDDFSRTDQHTTSRIDTIGTGFDISDSFYEDEAGNKTFKFDINKYYCDDFMLELVNGECQPSAAEFWVGIFISSFLYKSFQYGTRYFTTGTSATSVQKPNVPITKTRPLTEVEWRKNINHFAKCLNPNLKLSDLGITNEMPDLIFTTEYGWPGRLVLPLILYKPIYSNQTTIDYENINKKRLPQFKMTNTGYRIYDEYELIGMTKILKDINRSLYMGQGEVIGNENFLTQALDTMSSILSNSQVYTEIGVSLLPHVILSQLKKLTTHLLSTSLPKLTHVTLSLSMRTLTHVMATKLAFTVTKIGTVVLKSTLAAIKAASVVGLILDVIAIGDLINLVFDAYSEKNIQGIGYLNAISDMDLISKETNYGIKSPECSPIYIINLIKIAEQSNIQTEDSKLLNIFESNTLNKSNKDEALEFPYYYPETLVKRDDNPYSKISWETEYLMSLKYNSMGNKIDYDDDPIDAHVFNEMVDNVLNKYPTTYNNYKQYSENTLKRVNITKIALKISAVCLIISALIPSLIPIFIILFILAIVTTSPMILNADWNNIQKLINI